MASDLDVIAHQEDVLRFDSFDATAAWDIGTRLMEEVKSRGAAAAIDVQLGNHQLFFYAMPGTSPDNIDWLRRKKNVVAHFHQCSYYVGLKLKSQNANLQEKLGLPLRDYTPHGGCFPIKLKSGSGCIGTIAISGLPQRQVFIALCVGSAFMPSKGKHYCVLCILTATGSQCGCQGDRGLSGKHDRAAVGRLIAGLLLAKPACTFHAKKY